MGDDVTGVGRLGAAGLGLAIVARIAVAHGGAWLRSLGHEVLLAGDADSALDLAARDAHPRSCCSTCRCRR